MSQAAKEAAEKSVILAKAAGPALTHPVMSSFQGSDQGKEGLTEKYELLSILASLSDP